MNHPNVAANWTLANTKLEVFRAHPPRNLNQAAVAEFHAILVMLESAVSIDFSAFRIPPSAMQQRVVAFTRARMRRPGSVQMSDEVYCDADVFKRQVEGVAFYIQNLTPSPGPPKFGF